MPPTPKEVTFQPSIHDFIQHRTDKRITVLSGANNTGKSFILKNLTRHTTGSPYFVGVARYYNFGVFQPVSSQPFNPDLLRNEFISSFNNRGHNFEHNQLDLERIIRDLDNSKREVLFNLTEKLLKNKFSIKSENPNNVFSNKYLDMDGQLLSVSSSGTRLLITLLATSLNEHFTSLFIDEPELGLSPKLQAVIANYFFDPENQANYFPHLKQIFLATHSHLFLDRNDISNNFVVSKTDQNISISQIQSVIEFHRLQFNMLGNTFESLFLPSAIVIVEGKTDYKYLDKIIRLHLSDKKISVIQANSDDRTKEVVNSLKNTFGDLEISPFRERVFVILDSIHNQGLKARLQEMGVLPENIIVWDKNGIEYVYPNEIMTAIYHCGNDDIPKLAMNGDNIELNGINKTKNALADEVAARLTKESSLPDELQTKLLDRLNAVID